MRTSAIPAAAAIGLTLTGCSMDKLARTVLGSPENPVRVAAPPVETRQVRWQGWNAVEQDNGLIRVRHVPAAGGRTLSLEIGGDDAFLVIPEERGRTYPADSREGGVHFGGHYTCIGPERVWNVQDQPFNPHGGPYTFRHEVDTPRVQAVRLTSRPDTFGDATVDIRRTITCYQGSTHVVIDEEVTNRGSAPLDFYVWDFTQIDGRRRTASGRGEPRRISFYMPVRAAGGEKRFHSFLPIDAAMDAQFDRSLPADVLAVHYQAVQFKIATDPLAWWVAAVDHDSGWTYVKVFDAEAGARYVDQNGPVEIYGAKADAPFGGRFIEMELLGGLQRKAPGEAIRQREHWYACICRGPVLAFTPVGVVCAPLRATREEEFVDVTGRFGVFHAGTCRLRMVDGSGAVLAETAPAVIDPRRELRMTAAMQMRAEAAALVLVILDHEAREVGELARVALR